MTTAEFAPGAYPHPQPPARTVRRGTPQHPRARLRCCSHLARRARTAAGTPATRRNPPSHEPLAQRGPASALTAPVLRTGFSSTQRGDSAGQQAKLQNSVVTRQVNRPSFLLNSVRSQRCGVQLWVCGRGSSLHAFPATARQTMRQSTTSLLYAHYLNILHVIESRRCVSPAQLGPEAVTCCWTPF